MGTVTVNEFHKQCMLRNDVLQYTRVLELNASLNGYISLSHC